MRAGRALGLRLGKRFSCGAVTVVPLAEIELNPTHTGKRRERRWRWRPRLKAKGTQGRVGARRGACTTHSGAD